MKRVVQLGKLKSSTLFDHLESENIPTLHHQIENIFLQKSTKKNKFDVIGSDLGKISKKDIIKAFTAN